MAQIRREGERLPAASWRRRHGQRRAADVKHGLRLRLDESRARVERGEQGESNQATYSGRRRRETTRLGGRKVMAALWFAVAQLLGEAALARKQDTEATRGAGHYL